MTQQPLSPDFLKGLLAPKPTKPKATGIRRSSGFDDSERTVLNWLSPKNPHSLGNCSNPDCPDDRPRRVNEGNAMVSNVNGIVMCRLCFVAGYGSKAPVELDSGSEVV